MNIYHIVFTDNNWDEFDAFIVIAEDEKKAVDLIKFDIPKNEKIESISVIGVSNKSESEIVLGSFNAG